MHGNKVFPVAMLILVSAIAGIFFWRRKKPTMESQDFHEGYAV